MDLPHRKCSQTEYSLQDSQGKLRGPGEMVELLKRIPIRGILKVCHPRRQKMTVCGSGSGRARNWLGNRKAAHEMSGFAQGGGPGLIVFRLECGGKAPVSFRDNPYSYTNVGVVG